jgi:hypothetical protein
VKLPFINKIKIENEIRNPPLPFGHKPMQPIHDDLKDGR